MHVLEQFESCPKCGSSHFVEASEKSRKCENCGFEFYLNPAAAVAAFILNSKNELLVERRKLEPAKGMLDLPGGFCDMGETVEQAMKREIKEETALDVVDMKYQFSQPNVYRFSGFDVRTLDMFFLCKVADETQLKASDDAAECFWLPFVGDTYRAVRTTLRTSGTPYILRRSVGLMPTEARLAFYQISIVFY